MPSPCLPFLCKALQLLECALKELSKENRYEECVVVVEASKLDPSVQQWHVGCNLVWPCRHDIGHTWVIGHIYLTPKLRAEAYRVWHVSRPSRHGTRLVVAAECKFDPSSELRHTGYDPSAELPRRTQPVSSSPVARVRAGAGDREIGGPDGEGIMLRNSR
eukprot:1142224-Pelagomonas_calceolata.AAC.3